MSTPTWLSADIDDAPDDAENTAPSELDDSSEDPDPATENDAPGGGDDRAAAVAEAQRLRARAREAESERDTLRTRVDRLQLREVETLAARHLADATDLLAIGKVSMADLVGADGEVDAEAVAAACAALVQARGDRFARRRSPSFSPEGGIRGSSVGRAPSTLADALASSWQQERQR